MRSWGLFQHQYISQWYWSPQQAETCLWLCPERPCLCLCVSLISYTKQYMEYDPFVTTPELSNPWISDDPSLWDLDARYQSRNLGLCTVVQHRKGSPYHLVADVRHCWTAVVQSKIHSCCIVELLHQHWSDVKSYPVPFITSLCLLVLLCSRFLKLLQASLAASQPLVNHWLVSGANVLQQPEIGN